MVKTGCNRSGPLCGPTWTGLDQSQSGCLKSGKSKDRLRSGCLKIGAKDRTGPDFKTLRTLWQSSRCLRGRKLVHEDGVGGDGAPVLEGVYVVLANSRTSCQMTKMSDNG